MNFNFPKPRLSHIWLLVIPYCLLLCYYITKKSVLASMTHDESFSYLHYVHASFMDIISNQGAYSNNHLLNTLGMKYSEMVFGNSEIALRLPNLAALMIFLVYSFLILRRCNPVIGLTTFIILTANNTLIDFFGLARGYGMSIAFMAMTLYHLNESFNQRKKLHLILFGVGSLLAILSNFTLLTVYLVGLLVYNLIRYLEIRGENHEKFNFFKENRVNMVVFAVNFIILYEPVRKAVKFNRFDFGGQVSLWYDTISSIVFQIFTNIQMASSLFFLIRLLVLAIICSTLIILIVKAIRSDKGFIREHRFLMIINLFLSGVLLITVIQHFVLGTSYLTGRFALFLVPLVILNAGFLLNYLSGRGIQYFVYPFVISWALLAGVNFYRQADYQRCAEWGYDSETKNAMKAVMADYQNRKIKRDLVRIGVNWLFEPTVNYYRVRYQLDWLLPADRSAVNLQDDYCYIFENERQLMNGKEQEVLFFSKREGTMVLRLGAENR